MRNLTLPALLCAFVASSFYADAGEINFTYNTSGKDSELFGYKKKETYDIAICLDDAAYAGATVKGLRVYLPVAAGAISDVSGWISSELKLENKKNAPDLATKAGEVKDNYLDLTFDSPVVIPADGLYVGYSFTITDLDEQFGSPTEPIAVVESKENLDEGLWIHTSRTRLKWFNLAESINAVSSMVVRLETNFGPNDAAITFPDDNICVAGEEGSVSARIINHGESPIEDLGYSYTLGTLTGNSTLHFDTPIPASGGETIATLALPAITDLGKYSLTVTLETVNSKPNNDNLRTATTDYNVWPEIPVTRPLMEEFTGLGCGYCPRGYVAMEYMREHFGDLYVGLAYHGQGYESAETGMVTVASRDFPVSVSGYPFSCINREESMDPSYLPEVWPDYAAEIEPVNVRANIAWTDPENRKELKVTTETVFMEDFASKGYKLSIAIAADNLHNDAWLQSNYFSKGQPEGVDSPLWDIFIKGPSKVKGLIFNDVVAYYKDVKGIAGAIPDNIKAGEKYPYEYSVKLDDIKTVAGTDFLNEDASLHAVVMILDADGEVVNANKSASVWLAKKYDGGAGVEAVESADAEVVSTEWYGVDGTRLSAPRSGLCIRVQTLSDGSRRSHRLLIP